jgi:hypothetical protein
MGSISCRFFCFLSKFLHHLLKIISAFVYHPNKRGKVWFVFQSFKNVDDEAGAENQHSKPTAV